MISFRRVGRSPWKFALLAGAIVVATSCGSGESGGDELTSDALTPIKGALRRHPDERTAYQALRLFQLLSAQERVYLEHVRWDKFSASDWLRDRTVQKALNATAISPYVASASVQPTRSVTCPSGRITGPTMLTRVAGSAGSGDLFTDAVRAMTDCYGEATCNEPGCVAATLEALRTVYSGTPSNTSNVIDLGTWQCVLTFFARGQSTEQCSFKGFCRNAELTFERTSDGGTNSTYICRDSDWVPGPRATCPFPTPTYSGASLCEEQSLTLDYCKSNGLPPHQVFCSRDQIPSDCVPSPIYGARKILCCAFKYPSP